MGRVVSWEDSGEGMSIVSEWGIGKVVTLLDGFRRFSTKLIELTKTGRGIMRNAEWGCGMANLLNKRHNRAMNSSLKCLPITVPQHSAFRILL
jgi:hypothetical protein